MLNKALELEHAARIQYLGHAEQVDGLNAEPIIARLKEIAENEQPSRAALLSGNHCTKNRKNILATSLRNNECSDAIT